MGAYTKDFQYIAIGFVAGELVASAVKAEHKLLRGTVRVRRSCVLSHGVGLLRRDQIVPQETNYICDVLMRSALVGEASARRTLGEDQSFSERRFFLNRIRRIRMFAACHPPRRSLQPGRRIRQTRVGRDFQWWWGAGTFQSLHGRFSSRIILFFTLGLFSSHIMTFRERRG